MKKCVSCAKDLPDAALHCVFCGAKQAPIAAGPPPAGGPGGNQAKTVMGWQASDVLAGLQGKPTLVPGAQSVPAGPPPPQPAGPPPAALGHAATLAVSAAPPAAAPQPLGTAKTMMASPAQLGMNVPSAPAPAAPPPPAAPPAAAPPSGAATMMASPEQLGIKVPQAVPPAAAAPPPAAAPGPAKTVMASPAALGVNVPQAPAPMPPASPASGASTMFQPSPFANGASPMGGPGAPPPGMGGPMGGPPPGMGGPMGGPPPGMGGPMGGPPPGMGGPPMGMGGPGMPPGMGGPPPGMGGPGMPPPGMGGAPMGMGGPGMGGPGMPMGGPGMPPGMGGPPMGGPGMPPGMGGPGLPPGMGGPGMPMGGPGMPPGYPQPGMQQMPQPGQPYGAPPYLASRSAARAGAPFEPFNDGLRACLIIFGVLLLAAFVVPTSIKPMHFRWEALKGGGDALVKFQNIYLAAAGVLALVFGVVPLATVPRGALAAVLGVVPLVIGLVQHLKGPKVDWKVIVMFVSSLTLVAGLLLRNEYRSATLGRLLATIGALCIIAVMLVPSDGADPQIKTIIKTITDAPGKEKIGGILRLLPFVLAVASFLVWLPPPSSAGAKVLAWCFILLGVVTAYALLLVHGHVGDTLKSSLNDALLSGWASAGPPPLQAPAGASPEAVAAAAQAAQQAALSMPVAAAWLALLGYGLATVFGKNLEQAA